MTPIASATERGTGFTISLRNLLIVLLSIGAGAGLLGRLFLTNPQLSLFILGFLSVAVPFLFAIVTILVIGVRGKRRDLIAWSGCLVAIPIVGYALVFFGNRYTGTSPNNLPFQITAVLLEQRLPKQVDQPWVWQELERRANSGALAAEEADGAIEVLTLHANKLHRTGGKPTLSWSSDFLRTVTAAGLVSEPVLHTFLDAFHGPRPTMQPLPRLRVESQGFEIKVEYGNNWANHSDLPLVLLWDVDRVLVDGQSVHFTQQYRMTVQWSGTCARSLDAGEHQVEVELQCAYIDRNQLIGLDPMDLPPQSWSQAAKRWKKTASGTLHVYAADNPIVRLCTDPAEDPVKNQAVGVRRLVAYADRTGGTQLVVGLILKPALTVPLSFDVTAVLGGQSHPVGWEWALHDQNGLRSGKSGMVLRLESLDPGVRTADVILTPNPKHIETRPEVAEIWGQTIRLRNIPVERLDLDGTPPAEPQ